MKYLRFRTDKGDFIVFKVPSSTFITHAENGLSFIENHLFKLVFKTDDVLMTTSNGIRLIDWEKIVQNVLFKNFETSERTYNCYVNYDISEIIQDASELYKSNVKVKTQILRFPNDTIVGALNGKAYYTPSLSGERLFEKIGWKESSLQTIVVKKQANNNFINYLN